MKSVTHQSTLHLSFKIKCCVDRLRPPPPRGHPWMAKRASHKTPKIYQTFTRGAFAWKGVHFGCPQGRSLNAEIDEARTDLPLNFHPAAIRASANVTPFGAVSVPA